MPAIKPVGGTTEFEFWKGCFAQPPSELIFEGMQRLQQTTCTYQILLRQLK